MSRYQLGRTMAGKREEVWSESERFLEEKKNRRRKQFLKLGFLSFLGLAFLGMFWILDSLKGGESNLSPMEEAVSLKMKVVEMAGGEGKIGVVMKRFLADLEQDLSDLGMTVERVELPAAKIRELDLFLMGEKTYYKISTVRRTAELAEDMERMRRYLKEKQVVAGYVDLRIPGRAYYK